MIATFEPDMLTLMQGGTGELRKAVLNKGKCACAICTTMYQKTLVLNNWKDWVKRMNLASFADAPVKPANLVAYEKGCVVKPAAATITPPAAAHRHHLRVRW